MQGRHMLLIRPLSISAVCKSGRSSGVNAKVGVTSFQARAEVFAACAMLTVIADGVSRTTCRRRPWRR